MRAADPLVDAINRIEAVRIVNPDALRRSLEMVDRFPSFSEVHGTGHLALFDALNGCIDFLGGVMERPQCGNERSLNASGKYIEQLQTFLMYELQRAERAAENSSSECENDDESRLKALLQHRALLNELTTEQLTQVIATIDAMDAGRAGA
jgi:hypothetical protein